MRRAIASIAVAACVAGAAGVAAAEDYTLDNGLRVWLHPVTNAKHTAVVLVFDVGEHHDPAGQSGLAHLLQHCWVTAAAGARPARTAHDWVAALPVARNAQTGPDYTVFAAVVEPSQAVEALREHADRMGALAITDADVVRERARLQATVGHWFDDVPSLAACNRAAALVRPGPAGSRKGGLPAEVAALTAAQLQARWASVYKPGNARLMVAGAFNATAVRETIAAAFGPMARGDAVAAPRPEAAGAPGAREDIVSTPENPKQPPVAAVAVRAPAPADPHFAPFCVALGRLWDRQWTRRKDRVVVHYRPLDDPGVVCIATVIGSGETPDAAVTRLRAWIDAACAGAVEGVHRDMAKTYFAQPFGTGRLERPHTPDALYAAAFRHARLAQLGIDPGQLTRRLNAVIGQTFTAMRTAVLAPARQGTATATLKP